MTFTLRRFNVAGNNKGLPCPFKSITCQEGYCSGCQIYLDKVQEAATRAPLTIIELKEVSNEQDV